MKFYHLCILILLTACAHKGEEKMSFDAELSGFEYPYKVDTYKLSSQGKTLDFRYMDITPREKLKGVVVLLHGKNFSGYYWERVATDLVVKGYRVIVPDQIGFGKSSKPTDYLYSFHQLALNTMTLLKSLNVSEFILVGHSMGGMLGVHMSSSYSKQIKKLILINPIGLEDYLKYVDYKDPEFFYQSEVSKTVEKLRNYQKKNYYAGNWSEEYEKLLTPFKGWRAGSDWEQVAMVNALTYNPIFAEEVVSKFSSLKVPVTLIVGTRDRTGPGRNWMKQGVNYKLGQYQNLGKRMKSELKSLKLYELEDLGHMPQFENYGEFENVFSKSF